VLFACVFDAFIHRPRMAHEKRKKEKKKKKKSETVGGRTSCAFADHCALLRLQIGQVSKETFQVSFGGRYSFFFSF
jgi:hypothetical protein